MKSCSRRTGAGFAGERRHVNAFASLMLLSLLLYSTVGYLISKTGVSILETLDEMTVAHVKLGDSWHRPPIS